MLDSTRIVATFDLTGAPHGLYDVSVINPGDEQATIPYRFQVERAIPPEVTIGVGGPFQIPAGETGDYSVVLYNLSNLDAPYVHFQIGVPEMGVNEVAFNLPRAIYGSNLRGQPAGNVGDEIPWASLESGVNLTGELLFPGYTLDHHARGATGFNFDVATYPGLKELYSRSFDEVRAALYNVFPDFEARGVLDAGPEGLDELAPGLTARFLSQRCPAGVV